MHAISLVSHGLCYIYIYGLNHWILEFPHQCSDKANPVGRWCAPGAQRLADCLEDVGSQHHLEAICFYWTSICLILLLKTIGICRKIRYIKIQWFVIFPLKGLFLGYCNQPYFRHTYRCWGFWGPTTAMACGAQAEDHVPQQCIAGQPLQSQRKRPGGAGPTFRERVTPVRLNIPTGSYGMK